MQAKQTFISVLYEDEEGFSPEKDGEGKKLLYSFLMMLLSSMPERSIFLISLINFVQVASDQELDTLFSTANGSSIQMIELLLKPTLSASVFDANRTGLATICPSRGHIAY